MAIDLSRKDRYLFQISNRKKYIKYAATGEEAMGFKQKW
jgi:hypothetical protein